MSDVISKVCSLPKDFNNQNTKSMEQLFIESGYLEKAGVVTKEKIISYLTANPDLISNWEMYSSDKRYSPAWYFQKDKTDWIVGYFSNPSQEQQSIFQSKFEACAEFILHELKDFAEGIER